ncbi:MAG: glycoside hydrolase family 3 C-terminal domain-containing protein, partial [Bacteroidales bacterium]|nr:glycoside hydrolase family 3 C-terminal domain-containing protein [Bacteroidales bacterium]
NIDEHLNNVYYKKKSQYSYPHSVHAKAINTVQRWFVEETRLGIPVDFTTEGIRGLCNEKATGFPSQIALGCTWDKDLIYQIGEITGREARLMGYTNVYSPILDVARDPRWGRYVESYGEEPFLVSELGKQMVTALQKQKVVSTSKHFAVYSIPKGGRDAESRTDPHVAFREMHTLLLAPFKVAIQEAGGLGVMSSYNDYDGVPVTASKYFLTDILRNSWGFKGYVVSDSKAVEQIQTKHHVAVSIEDAVCQAVIAGLNVRTQFDDPENFIIPLRKNIASGIIPMSIIDDRVRDVLRVKFWLGLFDNPYVLDPEVADIICNSASSHSVSLKASRECIVLLKNNGLLPLNKEDYNTILVTGPNAADKSHAISRYGPSGIEVISVLEGIKGMVNENIEILYEKGCEVIDENYPESEIMDFEISPKEQNQIDNAVKKANISDIIIAVLGETEDIVGEGRTRTSLDLPGNQLELLKALYKTGKPIILVLLNGRPLSINWADKYIHAIIEAMFPGPYGGQTIAEVIFGKYNPGGKLAFTVPKTVGQVPYNFPYKPGSQNPPALWSSRMSGKPSMVDSALYPFGHGLSYTTFEYINLTILPEKQSPDGNVEVSFNLKNTGNRAGDEIVQLYISDKYSSVTTYESVLRGFERIHLKPNESKTITFQIMPKDLMILDRNLEWKVEPGEFEIKIGTSSENIKLKGFFMIN